MRAEDWTYSPVPAVETAMADIAARHGRWHNKSLDIVHALLDRLGNPHHNMPPTFHVAGTNGKGSTLAFLEAAFAAGGLTTHKYTSPHLVRCEERINIKGRNITPEAFLSALQQVKNAAEGLEVSFFCFLTAMAFLSFSRTKADAVLLETGMGGRLDATNAVMPAVSIITPVSLDHMHLLGDTPAAIAREKAGIIKKNTPIISAAQEQDAMESITQAAHDLSAPLYRSGNEWHVTSTQNGFAYKTEKKHINLPPPALAGAHQIMNAGTAIAALEQTKFSFLATPETLTKAMRSVTWPGRLQRLRTGPLVDSLPDGWELWIDGAHNDAGAAVLAAQARYWGKDKPLHIAIGRKAGREERLGFFTTLQPYAASAIALDSGYINAPMASAQDILLQMKKAGYEKTSAADTLKDAIDALVFQYDAPQRILVTGSLYLTGHILRTHG
ncbi:MAG: Mur ligase family protein [Alphaproteobacteria bacterium]|nr:Mur ligase family protein [Alphaproteobacteria bacterium]